MMKVFICLCLALGFLNVMANSHGGEGGVDGKANRVCPSGDATIGGRSISREGAGERSLSGAEGGGDSPVNRPQDIFFDK